MESDDVMKIYALFLVVLFCSLFLLVGCTQQAPSQLPSQQIEDKGLKPAGEKAVVHWKEAALTDVRTGETFKISDFIGKKVILESMAVWCPVCTQQQKNIQKLHEDVGDAVVSISVDTDPNEDVQLLKDHVQANGFTWPFAVSPVEVTRALIEEFGVIVVNAPSAPIILICEDQSTRLMESGLKSVAELQEELAKGC